MQPAAFDKNATRFVTRLRNSLRQDGLIRTLQRSARYPVNRLKNRWYYRMLEKSPPSEIFSAIYEKNLWGDRESASGGGSNLAATASVRRELPRLFEKFGILAMIDAPCGDFYWMQHVVQETGIDYHGADIVPPMIARNNETYGRGDVRFSVLDITRDAFPQADLGFCRDCLIHLSNRDVLTALENFCASGIPYVLTTTVPRDSGIANCDIPTGQYREINLYAAPFNLPADALAHVDDAASGGELALWSCEQVTAALPAMRRAITGQS
jgi:hypothetical protein